MLCKQWRKTCRFQRLDIKCKSVPSVTFPSWAKKTLSLAVRVLHDFYFEACIHSTHLFKGFMKSTFVKCCCIISEFAFKFYEIKRWLIIWTPVTQLIWIQGFVIVEHRDRDVVQFSEATCGSIFELNVVKVLLSKTFQLLSPFQSFRQSMNFPTYTVALPGIWFLLFFWSKSWRGLIGHLSSSINGAALIFDMATKRKFSN